MTVEVKKRSDEMKTLLIALVVAGGSVGPVVTTQAGPERGLIPIERSADKLTPTETRNIGKKAIAKDQLEGQKTNYRGLKEW